MQNAIEMQNVIEMQSAAEMQGSASQDNRASSDAETEDGYGDEYIVLPEDSSMGKILFSWSDRGHSVFCCTLLSGFYGMAGFYLIICNEGSERPPAAEWVPALFRFAAITIWIPVFFFGFPYLVLFWYDHAFVPLPALIYLLKEIDLQGSRNGKINWRQIAFGANELSYELERSDPVFYNGDHCMKFFRRHIVGAVENKSYKINLYKARDVFFKDQPKTTFGQKRPEKDLLDRSVEIYKQLSALLEV